ncbi:gfo/Idh/MocA family oxidoreductase [Aurantiacibacter xanthus]|uniref:Gfo/Idh/MocA family oxidoreductase n=1 Tax=Aurantiacibacter xanthus TaxID=1784712 RepID=A0A3A1P2X0_9SPHN|nr:Gfo/Idh/MocA family oxidoreductase [Aurantiacibacter xanthus]RIV80140.1 gfo/Idh/MocA family oxidoreductase [Aurantiacibacter xanthus]
MVRIALIGAGAIGERHATALANIDSAELAIVVSRTEEEAGKLGSAFSVPEIGTSFETALDRTDIDAVILATPTQMHAAQALQCLDVGKHVLVEIPLADSWHDALTVHERAQDCPQLAMVAHTSRYYPSNQYLRRLICAGKFDLLQMAAQTHFMRRSNLNAKGEPRVWTDHLLWHHAAHTIDLFAWQAGPIAEVQAMQGPVHPELGIAMDMCIQLKSRLGALCTLSLSFNNDGPIGSTFRYIGDAGTYIARRLGLEDGYGRPVDISGLGLPEDGVEVQDRDFVTAIETGKYPLTTVEDGLEAYRVIGQIEAQFHA